MLLLFDTAAGFALFKVLDEKKLEDAQDLWEDFETIDKAQKIVKLKAFSKFENTTEALAAATSLVDSKLGKGLKKFLKKHADGETLALVDAKLGGIIKEKLGIPCIFSNAVMEMTRGIRAQLQSLVSSLAGQDLTPMSLGLSHSLSRYKLKFSPDKVDTMIVQAIGLLDDLDKELNTYAMRTKEWYGWHFPEMAKIVGDNLQFARTVKLMGTREAAASTELSGILEEDIESALRDAAQISMGTEISNEDLDSIKQLCDQVIALSEYRAQLYDYLKSRMTAIAPNLTILVGELVGARLIAHAGSLVNLAKVPASTIQILGAEKALFRALKTKHDTPKYGLIFHASLVGQAAPKFKGKVSRALAAKCALGVRVDALGDDATVGGDLGLEARAKVEAQLRQLEGRGQGADGARPRGKPQPGKYDSARQQGANGGAAAAEAPRTYNAAADVAGEPAEGKKKKKREAAADGEEAPKKKKKKEKKQDEEPAEEAAAANGGDAGGEKKKKKKKREAQAEGGAAEGEEAPKKKKKKKVVAAE